MQKKKKKKLVVLDGLGQSPTTSLAKVNTLFLQLWKQFMLGLHHMCTTYSGVTIIVTEAAQ